MEEGRFRAGVELHGRAMRYAEVDLGEREDEGSRPPRLLRLGTCDFDFDVAEALLDLSGPTYLDTVARAVREIFEGSQAQTLYLAVHPWRCTSFFSPLPEGMAPGERFEQLRQEAAMLSDASVARPVRVKATPVRIEVLPDGRRAHWHHVLRLPEAVHARLAHVAKQLGDGARHEVVETTGAAAAVAGRLVPALGSIDDLPFALALGVYEHQTEYALCRGRTWYFGHYAEADVRHDGAYFGAALLDRLGVPRERVRHLFLYGEDVQSEAVAGLEALLGIEAEPLDLLRLFRIAQPGTDPLALSAFAPCVGALLR